MTQQRESLVHVLRRHLPRDRYHPEDGSHDGTFCTCGGWEGDYFADGDPGPFDDHLADAILREWLPGDLLEEDR